MTARGTCLIEAGSSARAPWIEALACFADNWTSRRIFEIAFAARFADLPHGATPARSNPGVIMGAKEGLQSEPRPRAPDFAACIFRIVNDRDQSAFELLFRHFAPRIKSYCLKLGADTSAAEEITQEAMVSIWRNAGQFDPSKAAPSTWIFTIARNLVIDRYRKSRRPQFDFSDPAFVPDDPPPPDRLIEQTQLQENVRQIMDRINNLVDVCLLKRLDALIERQNLIIEDRGDPDPVDVVVGMEWMTLDMIRRGAEVDGPTVKEHNGDVDTLIACRNHPLSQAVKIGLIKRLQIELWLVVLRGSWSGSRPWLRGHAEVITAPGGLGLKLLPAPEADEVVTVLLEEVKIGIEVERFRGLSTV